MQAVMLVEYTGVGSSPSSSALVTSSPTNSLTSSLNSYNSRERRYHRHQVTQMEHSLSNSLPYDHSEVCCTVSASIVVQIEQYGPVCACFWTITVEKNDL